MERYGYLTNIHCGADKVILTAPGKGNIKNIVFGVNDDIFDAKDKVISAALHYECNRACA